MNGDRTMEIITERGSATSATRWRIARWSAVAVMLVLPLAAMQFTDEVHWTLFDFMVAGALLVGACGTYELVTRRSGNVVYRLAMGVAILAALVLIWVIGAVGLIGAEGDPFDTIYLGVLAVGLLGSTMAGLEASAMGRAMVATALAQALVVVIALVMGKQHAEVSSVTEIVGVNGFFILLWVWSALLFRLAARQLAQAGPGHER